MKLIKRGAATDELLRFVYRYRARNIPLFPALSGLYDELYDRLVKSTAAARGIDAEELWKLIETQMQAA